VADKTLCLYCQSPPKHRLIRGTCEACYGVLISTVRDGTYTDQQLVDSGLLLSKPETANTGRPSTRVAMRDLRSGELDRRVRKVRRSHRSRREERAGA
jgi:hypothetical protein